MQVVKHLAIPIFLLFLIMHPTIRCSATTIDGTLIAFSGTGYQGNTFNGFTLSGTDNFSAHTAWPDWYTWIGSCSPGALCTLNLLSPAFNYGPAFSYGSLGSISTNSLSGSITFSSTFVAPFIAADTFTTLPPIPMTLSGQLQGVNWVEGYGSGPALFTVNLSGTGYMTLLALNNGAGQDMFNYAQFNYVGLASPVPEPSALLLTASGLIAAAGALRKKLLR